MSSTGKDVRFKEVGFIGADAVEDVCARGDAGVWVYLDDLDPEYQEFGKAIDGLSPEEIEELLEAIKKIASLIKARGRPHEAQDLRKR